jgi:alpha-galactosidase
MFELDPVSPTAATLPENRGLTTVESQAHFSLWAILVAPLIAGVDLTKLSSADMNFYDNIDVISINQDDLEIHGRSIPTDNGGYAITKPLANGDTAVVLFNPTDSTLSFNVPLSSLGVTYRFAKAKDLWNKNMQIFSGKIATNLASHSVVMYRMSSIWGQ